MKGSILFTSFSGDTHTVGIMYKEGLSIHRNEFAMPFAMLSFVPQVCGLFALFVTPSTIV